MIEHHEAGINRQILAVFTNGHGIRVTTGVVVLLKEREVKTTLQKVSAAQSGDSGSNDSKARSVHGGVVIFHLTTYRPSTRRHVSRLMRVCAVFGCALLHKFAQEHASNPTRFRAKT